MNRQTNNGYMQMERKGAGAGVGREGWGGEGRGRDGSHYSPDQLKERPTNFTCTQTELTSRWG